MQTSLFQESHSDMLQENKSLRTFNREEPFVNVISDFHCKKGYLTFQFSVQPVDGATSACNVF